MRIIIILLFVFQTNFGLSQNLTSTKKNNILSAISFKNHKHQNNLNKFQVNIGLNYNRFFGYNIRNNPPNFSKENKKFKPGKSFNLGVIYWHNKRFGLGLVYEFQKKEIMSFDGPQNKYFYSETLKLNTISLNLFHRWVLKNPKNILLLNIGGIYANYYTNVYNTIDQYVYSNILDEDYRKNIFGAELGFAYERNVFKHINIGIKSNIRYLEANEVHIQSNLYSDRTIHLSGYDILNLSRANIGLYISIN